MPLVYGLFTMYTWSLLPTTALLLEAKRRPIAARALARAARALAPVHPATQASPQNELALWAHGPNQWALWAQWATGPNLMNVNKIE